MFARDSMMGRRVCDTLQWLIARTLANGVRRFCAYTVMLLSSAVLFGCGGGDELPAALKGLLLSQGAPVNARQAPNVMRLAVDGGPDGTAVNVPYASVTICVPKTNRCETIDHVLVDTGSSGLRLLASSLKNPDEWIKPEATQAVRAECIGFASGYTWGRVTHADVRLGGEVAHGAAFQLIDAAGSPKAPTTCAKNGNDAGTLSNMQANGILGIGSAITDCGADCLAEPPRPMYFTCLADVCEPVRTELASQIHNPIALFDSDNNGSSISMPATTPGIASIEGLLTFGIGTRGNNAISKATIFPLDEYRSISPVDLDGTQVYLAIDSGSTGLYVPMENAVETCPKQRGLVVTDVFYCGAEKVLQARLKTGTRSTDVSIKIGNPVEYLRVWPRSTVVPTLGGPSGEPNTPAEVVAIFGMPFFFGRTVYTALEGANVGGVKGPFVAF